MAADLPLGRTFKVCWRRIRTEEPTLNEVEWVDKSRDTGNQPWLSEDRLRIQTGFKLAYGSEIKSYDPNKEKHI